MNEEATPFPVTSLATEHEEGQETQGKPYRHILPMNHRTKKQSRVPVHLKLIFTSQLRLR